MNLVGCSGSCDKSSKLLVKPEFLVPDSVRNQIKEDKKEQYVEENGKDVKKSGQNKNRKRGREDKHIKQFADKLCPSLHDEFSSFKKPCYACVVEKETQNKEESQDN